jgi:hypothetical protein
VEQVEIDVATLGLLVWVSAGITKLVDLVRNALDEAAEAPAWVWNVLSLGGGVGAALGLDLNAVEELVGGLAGQVVTGLAMGGSASGLHELFDFLSSSAKRE